MNSFSENPAAAPQTPPDPAAVSAAEPPVPPGFTGPRDPAWDGWDVLRLIFLTLLCLAIGILAALLVAKRWIYPVLGILEIARMPLVVVAGQAGGYLLVLLYMFLLVTHERRRPDFFAAIHWNWPSNTVPYLFAGFVLSLALQGLAHLLPIPKNLPIDTFFRTPGEAWALTAFGITLAPLLEELFFRGFLYPVLERRLGLSAAVLLTAAGFALLHGSQLMFAWGPVLVIFLVGVVLTSVRAKRNSVAAGLLIHIAYNGTISVLMFIATDGFKHLEKLTSQ